jgi:AcrR family transcriptional regulator
MPSRPRSLFAGALERYFSGFLRRMPRQARSRALVEAIVEALDEQLEAGADVDDITIEKLSDRAGVGIGSFYEYFSSKDSLLGALVGRVTEQNFVHLAARLDAHGPEDLEQIISRMARDLSHTYLARPKRMRVLVGAIGRLGLLSVVGRERDRFADVMAERARRLLPDEDEQRLRRTMQLIADAIMGVVVSAADRDPPNDVETVAEELAALALGLITRRHPEVVSAKTADRGPEPTDRSPTS